MAGVYDWEACLLKGGKNRAKVTPQNLSLGEMSDPRPIKVGDGAQPELAPVGFVGARCQKWVNIKLYLIKNRRKQSSSYLL